MTLGGRQDAPRRLAVTALVAAIGLISVTAVIDLLATSPVDLLAQGPAAVAGHLQIELQAFFQPEGLALAQMLLHATGLLLFVMLAAVIAWKRGGALMAAVAAITLATLGAALFAPIRDLPAGLLLSRSIGSLTSEALPQFWGSLAGISTLVFLAVFPDGRWRPAWTRWLVLAAVVSGIAAWVSWLAPLDPANWPIPLRVAWLIGVPAGAISAQVIRSRGNALGQGSRAVVLSLMTATIAFVLLWLIRPELGPGALDLVVVTPRLRAAFAVNILILLTIAVFMFPVSVSFAIVRHRLFDLDLLVNRTLVYGAITAVVGLAFLALAMLVAIVAKVPVSAALDGWAAGPVGVALGTLVVLTFQPLRSRVQQSVDRRFYRQRYDARRIIDRFATDAARVVDRDELTSELVSVVERALRPVWVRLHTGALEPDVMELLAPGSAIDLTTVALARDGAGQISDTAVLVPLVAGGFSTGVLELGPRISESRYSVLDLELLDRLARSAGPALQLAREVEAREREAEQAARTAHELELARKIQQGLLPHELPEVDGWSFGACYRPAREVGGDFYDWIARPDGRLVVVIGDVSDKGIPAALVMATCRTLIRVAVGQGLDPGDVLAEVNERLHPDIPSGMFVTCLVAIVEPDGGSIVIANAGHNLPVHRVTGHTSEIMARGMPLGLMPGMFYEQVDAVIAPGECIVLTSDGLAEAHDATGEMYGTERLRLGVEAGGADLVSRILRAHSEFVGSGWEQEDDITIVTVGRDAPTPDPKRGGGKSQEPSLAKQATLPRVGAVG